MFNLTKEEKLVLVFLAACFTVGLGVDFYKKEIASPALILEKLVLGRNDGETSAPRHDGLVNINTATFSELIKLKGIGKGLASRIIDYRRKNGLFFFKEDIMNVKGIGKKKFDSFKDYIAVE